MRELDPQSLRRNMGIVTQEVILFHDTVLRNIAYGLDSVPLEKVREAARAANADEFIMKLPHGYDTIIGDRGVTLSGGQRQRLSIARAILKRPGHPPALDEATSALDTESGEAGPGSHRPPGAQLHHHRHRPSPVDDPRRRPHLPARTGPGGAGRHARRAAGPVAATRSCTTCSSRTSCRRFPPMNQFAYVLRPSRPKMLTEGPTEGEARLVGEHFAYLQGLLAAGSLRLAGRATDSGERTFGIVIFEAVDSAAAAALMAADPAVKGGVMGAELFPFNIALMAGGAGVEG
ncbi:MAG: ATP-binding cassette domain-containing protein [bacterium]|nr:ATP-binding cassette domain-containing protein [bacterium]